MNERDIFQSLGSVDDTYIEEMYGDNASKGKKKRAWSFLILAAMLSLLGMAAFASDLPDATATWFEGFFGQNIQEEAEQELTQNQSEILRTGLVEINRSVTDQGYTITMESGLCDGYRALIKCRIDAPEDVVLDGRNYGLDYSENFEYSGGTPGDYSAVTRYSCLLEDDDPTDNSILCLLEIVVQPSKNSGFSMADGTSWNVTFNSIGELTGYDQEAEWRILCEGTWEFQITFEEELLVTESVELLSKPVRCECTMFVNNFFIRNKNLPLKADVISFELRSLSATMRISRPWIAAHSGVDLAGPVWLVMKDGSRVEADWQQTLYRGEFDESICVFERPVSIEDVEYIAFPGGEKVVIDSQ